MVWPELLKVRGSLTQPLIAQGTITVSETAKRLKQAAEHEGIISRLSLIPEAVTQMITFCAMLFHFALSWPSSCSPKVIISNGAIKAIQ